jgi:hypothetical protein
MPGIGRRASRKAGVEIDERVPMNGRAAAEPLRHAREAELAHHLSATGAGSIGATRAPRTPAPSCPGGACALTAAVTHWKADLA